jgi:hypothetical protein
MSWRKIEKVWDEVRLAKEPKRNLSKQPKEGREVKLNTSEQLQDLLSVAFDNERQVEFYREFRSFVDDFVVGFKNRLVQMEDADSEFWESQGDELTRRLKSFNDAREKLGMDYEDLIDYSGSDVSEAIQIFSNLYGTAAEVQDAIDELKSQIK